MNEFTRTVCRGNNDDPSIVSSLRSFSKRTKLCRDQVAKYFGAGSDVTKYVAKLTGDAETLAKKRNSIVHGEVWASIQWIQLDDGTMASELFLKTTSRASGKLATVLYSVRDLDDLFYEIAEIYGRLTELKPEILQDERSGTGLSLQDKSRLLELLRSSSQTLPNASTP